MSAPDPGMPSPDLLDDLSVSELGRAWNDHVTDLVTDRVASRPPRESARVRISALSALSIEAALIARLTENRWRIAVDALQAGATVEHVSAALDATPESVISGLTFWAGVELMLERRITRAQYDDILRLLPKEGDR